MPFYVVFTAVLVITVASGTAATILATTGSQTAARKTVADRLAQIALIGAAALAAPLGGEPYR